MASFSKIRDDIGSDLEDQVASLRKEVASLTKALSKRGAAAIGDTRESASDLYQELASRLVDAVPVLRKHARTANKSVQDNPAVAAVVGIAVVGLVISLFARR